MSDGNELVPVEQKQVIFYEDEITAVKMNDGSIFIPVRPLVERLGVAWSPQLRRINRDPLLSEELQGVTVTVTPGGKQTMMCLPLDYISGFLFGINANRVKPEIKESLIRYQRSCYKVLAEAFSEGQLSANTDFDMQLEIAGKDVVEAYHTAVAIMKIARNQVMLEGRIDSHERQLRFHDTRLEDVEEAFDRLEDIENALGLLGDDPLISEEQASQISQAVKSVAIVLAKRSGRNEFGGVYGQLYRRYSVSGYKMLPARQFRDAMEWLAEWRAELNG